jgi:hypothetical protein
MVQINPISQPATSVPAEAPVKKKGPAREEVMIAIYDAYFTLMNTVSSLSHRTWKGNDEMRVHSKQLSSRYVSQAARTTLLSIIENVSMGATTTLTKNETRALGAILAKQYKEWNKRCSYVSTGAKTLNEGWSFYDRSGMQDNEFLLKDEERRLSEGQSSKSQLDQLGQNLIQAGERILSATQKAH